MDVDLGEFWCLALARKEAFDEMIKFFVQLVVVHASLHHGLVNPCAHRSERKHIVVHSYTFTELFGLLSLAFQ